MVSMTENFASTLPVVLQTIQSEGKCYYAENHLLLSHKNSQLNARF